MKWKLATSFVLTAETWLGSLPKHGSEEAILGVGVSGVSELGSSRGFTKGILSTSQALSGCVGQIDEFYSTLLPSKTSEITVEEIAELR
jgi:hypothetical protein